MSKVEILRRWETNKLRPGRALIHTIRECYETTSPLLNNPAEDLFKTWDIISASLFDASAMTALDILLPRRTLAFGELGFVLDVPIQNILGTHHRDLAFPNHIGTEQDVSAKGGRRVTNSFALADAIFSGVNLRKKVVMPGGFNQIRTPEDLLVNTFRYNEVLLVGKEGINIYPGLPETGRIKVIEVCVFRKNMDSLPEHRERYNRLMMLAERLRIVNEIGRPVRVF